MPESVEKPCRARILGRSPLYGRVLLNLKNLTNEKSKVVSCTGSFPLQLDGIFAVSDGILRLSNSRLNSCTELRQLNMAEGQAVLWLEKEIRFHSCVLHIIRPSLFGFLLCVLEDSSYPRWWLIF